MLPGRPQNWTSTVQPRSRRPDPAPQSSISGAVLTERESSTRTPSRALDASSAAAGTGVSTRGGHPATVVGRLTAPGATSVRSSRAVTRRTSATPEPGATGRVEPDAGQREVQHPLGRNERVQVLGRAVLAIPPPGLGHVVDEVADLDRASTSETGDNHVMAASQHRSQSRRPSTPSSAGGSGCLLAIGRVATVEGPAMADIPDCHCGAQLQSALAGVQEAFQSSNGVWGQNGTEFPGMSACLFYFAAGCARSVTTTGERRCTRAGCGPSSSAAVHPRPVDPRALVLTRLRLGPSSSVAEPVE